MVSVKIIKYFVKELREIMKDHIQPCKELDTALEHLAKVEAAGIKAIEKR